jgi:hypothetical protein
VHVHGYGANLINQKVSAPDDIDLSDNVLAFVPYLAIHYACDADAPTTTAALCAAIEAPRALSLARSYAIVAPNAAALFSLVYATIARGSDPVGAAAAASTGSLALRRYPEELIRWPVDSTQRVDLPTNVELLPALNWSKVAMPRDECDALRWEASPFERRPSGDGLSEEDPVHFLLSYWLGRKERLIS